ncbi:MFS transporter [Picrophilus oshimae]|nr:MFS transporter [Picrophilus oshimae]
MSYSIKVLSSYRKRLIRLTPMLFFLYVVNFLDRVNLSYAIDAGMFQDIGAPANLASLIAGIASAMFFVAYAIPQVFTNLKINTIGIRKIFALAFGLWGIITILTGFVTDVPEMYALRFFLGLAEAPFYAGTMFFLGIWFSREERGLANGFFNAAIPVAGIFGGLIAGSIFTVYHDYPGWRYLFIIEGILALISIPLLYVVLSDFPDDAKWLSKSEKEELDSSILNEEKNKPTKVSWRAALRDRDVILYVLIYFFGVTALYGYTIWLPSIISSFSHVSAAESSFLSDIPYIVAAIALIFILRYSDRSGNRKILTFYIFFIAFAGLALSAFTERIPDLSFVLFTISAIGIFTFLPVFWTMPQEALTREGASAAIGLINALGNLGGVAGPIIVGGLESLTHSFVSGVYSMAAFALIAGLITLMIKKAR